MPKSREHPPAGGPIPPVTDHEDLPKLPKLPSDSDVGPSAGPPESEDYNSYLRLWSALRFVFRDACLEGETDALRGQIKHLTDYELSVMRAGVQILYVMSLDEHVKRGLL